MFSGTSAFGRVFSSKLTLPQKMSPIGRVLSNFYVSLGCTFLPSVLFRYKGWLAGYQLAIDTAKTAKTRLTQSNFAIGYTKDDLTLHTAV